MKQKPILFLTAIVLASLPQAMAQKTFSFSARQAVDHAMKNAIEVKNAMLDIQIQQQSNREFTAIAFPQISSNVSVTHFLDIPTTTLPDFISPAVYGVLVNNGVVNGSGNPITFPPGGFGSVPARFGTSWNATGGFDLSQIIFDGQVFVGLKARSAAIQLAKQAAAVTTEQIKANVLKLYYQLIVGKKQSTSIDANITRFEMLLEDTRSLYKNGFVEKLDADKIEVQLNNLKTEKEKIENQLETGNAALKFLINLPQSVQLTLTDTLSDADLNRVEITDSIDFNKRIEYQQLSTAIRLSEYNVQRFRMSRLPTLVAFGSYSKNAQRNAFNFFNDGLWFNTSLFGFKMSMTIFDGNARNAKIQKARLELNKVNNSMEKLRQGITFEVNSAANKLNSALKTLNNQKKNTELAQQIYKTAKMKYEQGTGSNMEIYNAQTEYKVSENNYFGALYDAIIAKIDYLKASGTLQY
jgi:outer membrane protein